MNTRCWCGVIVAPAVVFLLLLVNSGRTQPAPAQPPAQPGVEVLASGPVHEAFAEPTTMNPEPPPVIPKQPPELIEELPPDQKPEGDNVQWIPGYWAWDDEAKDFIWVSGCWRDVPPGRRWVPGHWQEVEGGWMWVAGFWATEDQSQIQYLPPPPPSVDQGPATPAPDPNSTYIPGSWVYQQNRYLWQPGFWTAYRPNWVWIPASYIWTPSGYIFIDGYWDYPMDQRGMAFAPALINQGAFLAGRQPYIPYYAVNTDFLLGSLFVRQATRHYYFGNYFGAQYANRGFVPWPDYHPGKGSYDPNFAYYRHVHAADKNWEPALRNLYTERRNGGIPAPPRTLARQIEAIKAVHANNTANVTVHKNVNLTHVQNVTALTPFREIHNTRVTNLGSLTGGKGDGHGSRVMKLEPVSKEARAREQKAAAVMREGARQRQEAEARILSGGKVPAIHTDAPHVVKTNWPKLPAAVGTPRPARRVPPPAVTVPKHEERPIPKHEPPRHVGPPKKKDKP